MKALRTLSKITLYTGTISLLTERAGQLQSLSVKVAINGVAKVRLKPDVRDPVDTGEMDPFVLLD
jgi:hypothetical protein